MELRGNQVSRILNIIQILYAKKNGITAKELSITTNTSLKTAYRDLSVIENSGFPMTTEIRNGTTYYKFIESFKQEFPLTFSFNELIALYYSKNALSIFHGTELQRSLDNIIKKVKNVLPKKLISFLKHFENNFQFSSDQKINYHGKNYIINTINTAIASRKTLILHYKGSKKNEASSREIDPYSLYVANGLIYIVGYCHLRKDIRIFATPRIENIKISDKSFSIPLTFDPQKYFDGSFQVFRGKKETVILEFNKAIALYIKEKQLPGVTEVKESDQGIIMQLYIAITPDFKTFLMSWGENLKIIEPQSLRDEIKNRHKLASELT